MIAKLTLNKLLSIASILAIVVLIFTGTIHHEEAFVFGTIALYLLINLLTGWSPFCDKNCTIK